MDFLKVILVGTFLVSMPLALVGCDDNNSFEEATEEVSDEFDDATTN